MKRRSAMFAVSILLSGAVLLAAVGCGGGETTVDTDPHDKDFSPYRTASAMEAAYDYKHFFLPEEDAAGQGYVGDPMPYYEDGTYYIYYLKDQGDSYNHSVYLTTTQDFVTYEEYQEPVLEASRGSEQDAWIGTGSVVKVGEKYYFFYTGHNTSREYHETIMVAEGDSPTSFVKKEGWEILPPESLGQKNDFRDPQAYYDAETDTITLTITAAQSDIGRIVTYTLNGDLSDPQYGGIIFTNPEDIVGDVWNLECSDTFQIGGRWYLTFSAQDGALWYTSSDTRYGVYEEEPCPLDGQLFYAAKTVTDGTNTYMVGWARRSESPSSTQDVNAWAGNLVVQKVVEREGGGIVLAPVDAYLAADVQRTLLSDSTVELSAGDYVDAFTCQERFVVTGQFSYTGTGDFGLAFDYNGRMDRYKLVSFSPEDQEISLSFNLGSVYITGTPVTLEAGRTYSFTYLQEGSVGIMYLDGETAFTVRVYGVSGRAVRLFAENNSVTFSDLRQFTYSY
ncbi:MAG TPA: hypothetical protein H9812_04600 [Candidatus Gallimonas intestinigallinarum]|uniref:beta-fructofuranosidase n=1 Tax=Candidatus Gallimonas intestinigallinarum TaxID=2838604 RepID=A0A9D2IVH4_9FIRM|nr:hypothetical protein [Candidatus Gallimonas intestinigallinarum]